MSFNRILGLLVITGCLSFAKATDSPFTYDSLVSQAKALAAKPYEKTPADIPSSLRALNYDGYRDIRFKTEQSWGRSEKLPFELQFFHPGFLYDQPVAINEIQGDVARPIPFLSSRFDYGKNKDLGPMPADLGYAGFRIHYALNNPEYLDELAVFQGASYFRVLGKDMRYGLSARGLAIDTGEPTGEEFPVFTSFWIEHVTRGADTITVYALLDSPSVTGAYRFVFHPGETTMVNIKATLVARKKVKVFGVAPLTSMFWFGESNMDNRQADLRPEVHDSDGLMIKGGNGEWLWRPLVNPKQLRVSSYQLENPRGFGLSQRDRAFTSYEDFEAHYQDRPSLWVEPLGNWGKGAVRLFEIPTPDETNDNIVAMWVPAHAPAGGESLEIEYNLHWFVEGHKGAITPPAGQAVATRFGRSLTHEPDLIRIWVDFNVPGLDSRKTDKLPSANVTVGQSAELVHKTVVPNPETGGWRLAFAFRPAKSPKPVEMRAYLSLDDDVLTETWSYLWSP